MNSVTSFELNSSQIDEVNGGILPVAVTVFVAGVTVGRLIGDLTK